MTAVEIPADVPTPAAAGPDHLFRRLIRRPLALISLLFLALVGLIAIIGPWIAPYDPNLASLQLILAPPSAEHLLGTDSAVETCSRACWQRRGPRSSPPCSP